MNHNFIILPIVIPLLTGVLLIFFNKRQKMQICLSAAASVVNTAIACFLVQFVKTYGIVSLEVGGWKAPFGIVLVADMYASLLVLTANIVVLACLFFSYKTMAQERIRYFYYSGVMFLLTGVSGAFLTGDIFNLFVFFEVMLMASYFLIVHGNSKPQLRESIKYILVNVISSALFVISVAFLYAVTGTLNMADLSLRVKELGSSGIITVISIMFLIVFGLKSALFPLFFWLPGSYQAPPSAIASLFGALLTKVGVYSITRVFTLIFLQDTDFTHTFISWLAVLTIIFGVIGSISYPDIKQIMIYNILTAVGIMLFGMSTMTKAGMEGAVYYIIHDMIIKSALFLLVGAILAITGTTRLHYFSGLIQKYPALGWLFLVAALSLSGIPPFSGFIGKLKVVEGGFENGDFVMAFVVLLSSLLILYSVMKIFINGFWGEENIPRTQTNVAVKNLLIPITFLVAISTLYGFCTEFISPYITQAGEVLLSPDVYVKAVLKE